MYFTGDGSAYLRGIQARQARRLIDQFQQGLQAAQQADAEIEELRQAAIKAAQHDLKQQQALDHQFGEFMGQLEEQMGDAQQQTQATFDEMQGCLEELNQPFNVDANAYGYSAVEETEVQMLERLFNQ